MTTQHDLLELEHRAWEALTTSGEAAARHFADVLADSVLMLLPGGLLIDSRDRALESMRGTPWSSVELGDERVVELGPSSAVVAYRATASRDGEPFTAWFSSTYVHDGSRWRLAVHQQTPR